MIRAADLKAVEGMKRGRPAKIKAGGVRKTGNKG
jgi:hypothetical protein